MDGKAVFRDDDGRTLADYPRPSVAVDTTLMTVIPASEGSPARLGILRVRRPPQSGGSLATWAPPGTFLHEGETLAEAVRRSLEVKAGVTGREPQQLHVDDPARDDRGWVLSVAHLDVLAFDDLERLREPRYTRIAPLPSRLRLPYDHLAIIDLAIERLRLEYRAHPDPRGLLLESFTIADLRAVHEAVAGRELQKDTFRRLMIDELESLPAAAEGRRGRPAKLFGRSVRQTEWPTNSTALPAVYGHGTRYRQLARRCREHNRGVRCRRNLVRAEDVLPDLVEGNRPVAGG